MIELIVAMAVSGIFFTLAMNMFITANGSFIRYKKSHEAYFDYNVKKAIASRMLDTHQGSCDNEGNFRFLGISADSLNKVFPFSSPKCKKIDRKRSLVYYLGILDSTSMETIGFGNFNQN